MGRKADGSYEPMCSEEYKNKSKCNILSGDQCVELLDKCITGQNIGECKKIMKIMNIRESFMKVYPQEALGYLVGLEFKDINGNNLEISNIERTVETYDSWAERQSKKGTILMLDDKLINIYKTLIDIVNRHKYIFNKHHCERNEHKNALGLPTKKKSKSDDPLNGILRSLELVKSNCSGSTRKPNEFRNKLVLLASMRGGADDKLDDDDLIKLLPKRELLISGFLKQHYERLLAELEKRGKTVDNTYKTQMNIILENLIRTEGKLGTFQNILREYLNKNKTKDEETLSLDDMGKLIKKYSKLEEKKDIKSDEAIKLIQELADAVMKQLNN